MCEQGAAGWQPPFLPMNSNMSATLARMRAIFSEPKVKVKVGDAIRKAITRPDVQERRRKFLAFAYTSSKDPYFSKVVDI